MRRVGVFLLVSVLSLVGVAAPAWGQVQLVPETPASVEASQESLFPRELGGGLYDTDCPQITDSIYRLYSAYFLREPDMIGWSYWLSTYGSRSNTNLEVVSDSFAISDEFVARYGHLTNAEFVTLVYQNVLGRDPDSVGFAHWVGALDGGYPRGAVMIAFSESEEYVNKTATWAPQAGYLQWYDRSFTYHCGVDLTLHTYQDLPISAAIPTPHADTLFLNLGAAATDIHVEEVRYNVGEPLFGYDALPAQRYGHVFNVDLVPGAAYLRLRRDAVDVTPLYWSVVFYDHPHSIERPGFGGYDWSSGVLTP